MDFSGISLLGAINQILSFAMIIVGGYAAIWASRKVIYLIKYDCLSDPNDPANYDHDVFKPMPNYGPPRAHGNYDPAEDSNPYDPNGNYFRRDGMWRKYSDFENSSSSEYDYDSLIAEQEQRIFEKESQNIDQDSSSPEYDYDSLIAEQEQRIFEKESQNIDQDSSSPEYDYDSLIAEQEQRIFEKESQNIDQDSSSPEYDYDLLIAEQEQRIFEKESQNKFNDDII